MFPFLVRIVTRAGKKTYTLIRRVPGIHFNRDALILFKMMRSNYSGLSIQYGREVEEEKRKKGVFVRMRAYLVLEMTITVDPHTRLMSH